jgi:type III secretion system YscQ/HrcQ family protein
VSAEVPTEIDLDADGVPPPDPDAGPFGTLPKLSSRHVQFTSRLDGLHDRLHAALDWLVPALGEGVAFGPVEIVWRPAGLRRAGVVIQLGWPRLVSRVGIGLDATVAHAVVDRMLGFSRLPAEGRLSVSPVEWGVLSYVAAEALRRLEDGPRGPLGAWDLSVDRVGPDPFDASGLGRLVTLRWPLRLGEFEGSARLWLPEGLIARWLTFEEPAAPARALSDRAREGLVSVWRAEAGTIALARGLKTLRVGGVLPLAQSPLRGSPRDPTGAVQLTLDLAGRLGRLVIPAEPAPMSGGGRVTVTGPTRQVPTPREALAMPSPAPTEGPAPAVDVPVTLAVELGRLNLPLSRLADLKPGEVLELGRHSREPVELTSGGRLVARGELVLIDTELGVRVTSVFL